MAESQDALELSVLPSEPIMNEPPQPKGRL